MQVLPLRFLIPTWANFQNVLENFLQKTIFWKIFHTNLETASPPSEKSSPSKTVPKYVFAQLRTNLEVLENIIYYF